MNNTCSGCHGTGIVIIDCPYCKSSEEDQFGELEPSKCPTCNGKGYLEDNCPLCHGTGALLETDNIINV